MIFKAHNALSMKSLFIHTAFILAVTNYMCSNSCLWAAWQKHGCQSALNSPPTTTRHSLTFMAVWAKCLAQGHKYGYCIYYFNCSYWTTRYTPWGVNQLITRQWLNVFRHIDAVKTTRWRFQLRIRMRNKEWAIQWATIVWRKMSYWCEGSQGTEQTSWRS